MYGMATGLSPVCRKDGRHWRINALHTIRDNNVFSPTQNGNLWQCDFVSGTSQRPTGSLVLTPHGEVIYSVSNFQMNQRNKHQVALPVTPCFHARKALLLCGSFLGSILAVATRKKELRCICASLTQCAINSKFGKNTPHWCILFNANPTVSITHAWRLGVVLCEGRGHSWKLTITKHLCTTKFPILKMWGWKSEPHYTLGNPIGKESKSSVLVLAVSASLWKNNGNPLQ